MTPPAWRAAAEGLRAILVPPEMAQLSAEGRARLLRMTLRSVGYSISTIPGLSVPLVLFAMYRGGTAWPLLWTAFYLGLTALVWWLWRRFVQDEARLTPADLLAKWRPPLDRPALLHGLGVGSAVLLTLALPFFLRFLLASWGLILLHVTRSFPEPWPYWLVLGLLFVLGLYRHAVAAHRFVFEQLRLEEHSQELSRHLGAAKEAAEAALHDRNRFLSTASHDLRQPVHAMGMLVAALQARIFAPGYRTARAERARSDDDVGHGLSLAVVAQAASLLGVGYGMRSRLGRGSCFWLRLRAAAPPAARPMAGSAEASAPRHGLAAPIGGRCLVVDDEPQVLAAWRPLLQGWGIEACCVLNGAAAWDALGRGFAPDVILCDQRLRADEDGFELLQALLARCPAARGAMVSGEFSSPALAQAEDEGYVVLRKPLDPAILQALLARWMASAAAKS